MKAMIGAPKKLDQPQLDCPVRRGRTPWGKLVGRTDYRWDVFVSFRRYSSMMPWIENHFKPTLAGWLEPELTGEKPRIFVDEHELESVDWPLGLAEHHSESAVLVVLHSQNYLESPWCRREYELMLARERETGFASGRQPIGLIVKAIVHDGDDQPAELLRRNGPDLYPYVNSNLSRNGKLAEKFENKIKEWAPSVAAAIKAAPPRQDHWLDSAVAVMNQAFDLAPARQTTVPGRIR